MGWLLVLGLKEGLVECATVYVKSEVMLIRTRLHTKFGFQVALPIVIKTLATDQKWSFWYLLTKELHHKKAVTLLFGVRRSRLGPIQSQAVLKRPEWRASAKLAESPVMIIKSVFSLWVWAISQRKIYALGQLC